MEVIACKNTSIVVRTNNFYFNCAASKSIYLALKDLFHILAVLITDTLPDNSFFDRAALKLINVG